MVAELFFSGFVNQQRPARSQRLFGFEFVLSPRTDEYRGSVGHVNVFILFLQKKNSSLWNFFRQGWLSHCSESTERNSETSVADDPLSTH
jgi:hypothetical protein